MTRPGATLSPSGTLPHASKRARRVLSGWATRLLLFGYAAFVAVPFIWTASIAFKPPEDYTARPPVLLPTAWTLNHFSSLADLDAWSGLRVSLIVAVVSSLLSVVLGGMAGFSFARFNTGGPNLAVWVISQRLMPPVAVLVPIFLLLRTVGLVDSVLGLILLYTVFSLPFSIWIVRSFFMLVPADYEDAASIDGASRLQTMWHINLPLGLPALMAAGAFAFVVAWTEFLFASVITRTNAVTLPVVISGFLGVQSTLLGALAAMVLISGIPAILIGVVFHRRAVAGLAMQGIKG